MLKFFTRSFSARFVLWVIEGCFAASPVMYFISRIVFIYFISSPFSHWRGKLRKERDVQTSLGDFCPVPSLWVQGGFVFHICQSDLFQDL